MVQVRDKIHSTKKEIDLDFLFLCIKSGDIWELSNYEDDPTKVYFLKYRIAEDEVLIWDKNEKTIFSGKLSNINKAYLKCVMKKVKATNIC